MLRRLTALFLALLLLPAGAVCEFIITDRQQEESSFFGGPAQEQTETDGSWPRRITVTLGGDCTLGCTDSQRRRETGFSRVIAQKGYEWPFSALLPIFAQDDMTLVNFEGTLTESEDKVSKKFNFKGPAEYARMLTLGSVECVNLANNHYGDYGPQGKEDTRAALDAEGIVYCGSGITAVYEVRGVRIGLIGHTFPYTNGKCDISKEVASLREQGCQIVIASFHWGSEYQKYYSADQRNIGRAALKAGADLVAGHHPHIVQGIEAYDDSYILYSLGNLVFGGNTDPDDRDTYLARVTFTVEEDGSVSDTELEILPVRLTALRDGTDYRPVPAEGETARRIVDRILSFSANMSDYANPY